MNGTHTSHYFHLERGTRQGNPRNIVYTYQIQSIFNHGMKIFNHDISMQHMLMTLLF